MNSSAEQGTNRVIPSGNPSGKFIKDFLLWPLRLLKLIKRLGFQFFIHFVDASYDLYRFMRYSNAFNFSSNDPLKLEALLFFYYHKIEKALSLPDVKPLFGLAYIETTLDLAEKWAQRTGDLESVVFQGAYAALSQYQKHVEGLLLQARPGIALRLNQFLTNYERPGQNLNLGGTVNISYKENHELCQNIYFERLIRQRHSVRNFIDRRIPDSEVINAVALAQHTPSVCNRQSWRVHVFTSPYDKARILQQQNGNEGFGHLADRVLLITSDLRSFLLSGEHHQAYIDVGMFAMTLVLAFEAQGIVSCCLNLSLSAKDEVTFRRESRIPKWEVPVMLIIIGYPPERLMVAVSSRKIIESMLTFHESGEKSLQHGKQQPHI